MVREFSLVTTTCPDLVLAETIAQTLLQEGLAACIQIIPMHSFYTWEGVIERAQEQLLLIKSKTADWEMLALKVREMHTAQVPQIVRLDIEDADPTYADWIRAVTRPRA